MVCVVFVVGVVVVVVVVVDDDDDDDDDDVVIVGFACRACLAFCFSQAPPALRMSRSPATSHACN